MKFTFLSKTDLKDTEDISMFLFFTSHNWGLDFLAHQAHAQSQNYIPSPTQDIHSDKCN